MSNNTNQFNEHDFGKFLLEANLVAAGREKYLVYWVRMFFQHRLRYPNLPWFEQLPLFLQWLQENNQYQDWQIRQADQGVRLYFNNFAPDKHTITLAPSSLPLKSDTLDATLNGYREALRLRGYARKTEKTYLGWTARYYQYCSSRMKQQPDYPCPAPASVRDFLAYLALRKNVSSSTQNLAFNSLLMFFRLILNQDLADMKTAVRARQGQRLPTVFSIDEMQKLLPHFTGTSGLILRLIYGSGLRVSECCRLRIQDVDFDQRLLFVRDGKGGKDRTTVLANMVIDDLRSHIARVFKLHDEDLAAGHGVVWLPRALARKYPGAGKQKSWQYLFPSAVLSIDPEDKAIRRHHVSDSSIQRAMKAAVVQAGIHKHASVHTLRHSFATHLLLGGVDIRQIQEYLGHAKVETTMIYTHVIKDLRNPAASPLDLLTG